MSRQYPNRPVFGVGAVIVRGDEVLLIQRGREPKKGCWSLPGGAQKIGETVKQALIREVKEETGLIVAPLRLLAVVDIIDKDDDGNARHHYTVADFLCEATGGTLRPGGDAADARWVKKSELGDYRLTQKAEEVTALAWKS